MQACFVETELKQLSGIFYLVNAIDLTPANNASFYTYTNLIFKIEGNYVTLDIEDVPGGTNKAPVIYSNGTAVRSSKQWNASTSQMISYANVLTNKFIEIIYKIYGTKYGYVAKNDEMWTLKGQIDNIQKIEYETNNAIRMRGATYHK